MSAELEQRLQEGLDAEQLSDKLRAEVAGHKELESMVDQDAALRSMPRPQLDLRENVLGRLDEDLEDIPGLFDAPHFEKDLGPATPTELAATAPARPVSLADERRKRSGAPFLLIAAAVVGLVATGTLMTLNAPAREEAIQTSNQVASRTSGESQGNVGEISAPAPEPVAATEAADTNWEPVIADQVVDPAANLAEGAEADEVGRPVEPPNSGRATAEATTAEATTAPARSVMRSAGAPLDDLSSGQQRTIARIESCLPDHIRITRVRQSVDRRRVVGVDTSEPLSDEVAECVSGVLDTIPRARRRPRATSMSVSGPVGVDEKPCVHCEK